MKISLDSSSCLRIFSFTILSVSINGIDLGSKVVGSVNCGGPEITGAHNIKYSADNTVLGTASDFGTKYAFRNAYTYDVPIYQTERWHSDDFTYSFPVKEDGKYVVVLKFSEVYFQRSNEKVFDVSINGVKVLVDFDIFAKTKGRGFAIDHYIPITIEEDDITVIDTLTHYGGVIFISFEKGLADNPKVNGIAIVRGELKDMPKPPELIADEDDDEDEDESDEIDQYATMKTIDNEEDREEYVAESPNQQEYNPFEKESDFHVIIAVITAVIFIPIVYFLQKNMRNV